MIFIIVVMKSFFKSRNKYGNQKQNFQPLHKNFSLPKASCFHLINQSPGNSYKSCAYSGKKNPKFNYKKFLSWIDVIFNAVFFHLKAMFIYIVLFYVLYNDQSYKICNFMPTSMSSLYLDNIVKTHTKKTPTKHLLIKKGKTLRQVHYL